MNKTKKIIISSIVLLSLTTGVYAVSSVDTVVDNIRTAYNTSADKVGDFGKVLVGLFDNDGYIKSEFIKDNSITGNKIVDDTISETQIDDNFVAKNSDKLDGKDSTEFLGVNDTAKNSLKLEGKITETTLTDTDTKIPTSKAVKTYVDAHGGGKFVDGTNSTQAVYNGGNVGIGTNDPKTPLHIDSTADVQGNDSLNGALVIGQTSGDHLSLDNNELMAKNANNTAPLYIQNQGGTARFGGTIESNVPTDGTIMKWNSNGFMKKMTDQGGLFLGSDSSLVINAGDHNNNYEADLGIANNTTAENLWLTSDGGINFVTGYQNGIGSAKRSVITGDGRLGLGTTSPSAKLEIKNSGLGLYLNQNSANDIYMRYHVPGVRWWTVGPKSNGDFRFSNTSDLSGSVPLEISTNGNVGIGTTGPTQKLDVNGNIRIRGRTAIFGDAQTIYGDNSSAFYVDSNNSDYSQMIFRDKENKIYGRIFGSGNGSDFGLLDGDGNRTYRATKDYRTYFYIDNDVKMYIDDDGGVHATSFIYTSDKRLKKDIHTLENSLEKINKLRGVNFKWKENNEKEIGLIAQEVEKVYPDLVNTNEEDGIKSVKYGNIVAILIEGVKELYNKVVGNSDEIEKLKIENVELKNRLELLEGKINKLVK